MLKTTVHRNHLLTALAVVVALAWLAGCGTKKESESASSEKTATTTETQGAYGEQKTEAAPDTAQAADWSAFSNPKPGICPVCQMVLERAYIQEVTIAEKKYACCSARCVATLSENPDQYLSAAASTEHSHEH